MIRYFIEQPSPLKRYALKFLLTTAGYPAREVATSEDADLFYGNAPLPTHSLTIPDCPSDVIWADLLTDNTGNPGCRRMPFDIVSATASLLTDRVNDGRSAYDAHGRLRYAHSFQAEFENC